MVTVSLDERTSTVLHAAVERYIRSGEPVASKELSRDGLPFSPATIRAVMARLEDAGLMAQPHTSAGRVPTNLGYRVYVDSLAPGAVEAPSPLFDLLRATSDEITTLVQGSAQSLASAAGLAGFAISMVRPDQRLRHIEFVRLGPGEILAVVATHTGAVHHRLIRIDTDYQSAELDRFHNFLNERFLGVTLVEVRAKIRAELDRAREEVASTERQALELSDQALPSELAEVDIAVDGRSRLMLYPEFASGADVRPVLEELDRRETWVALLDAMLRESGPRVFIGPENAAGGLQSCTVIAATVRWRDGVDGTVGLIGPTRLDYRSLLGLMTWVYTNLSVARGRGTEAA